MENYTHENFLATHEGPLRELLQGIMAGGADSESTTAADHRRCMLAVAIASIHCGGHKHSHWTFGKILATRIHVLTSSTAAVDVVAANFPGAPTRRALFRTLLRESRLADTAGGGIAKAGSNVAAVADNCSSQGYQTHTARIGTDYATPVVTNGMYVHLHEPEDSPEHIPVQSMPHMQPRYWRPWRDVPSTICDVRTTALPGEPLSERELLDQAKTDPMALYLQWVREHVPWDAETGRQRHPLIRPVLVDASAAAELATSSASPPQQAVAGEEEGGLVQDTAETSALETKRCDNPDCDRIYNKKKELCDNELCKDEHGNKRRLPSIVDVRRVVNSRVENANKTRFRKKQAPAVFTEYAPKTKIGSEVDDAVEIEAGIVLPYNPNTPANLRLVQDYFLKGASVIGLVPQSEATQYMIWWITDLGAQLSRTLANPRAVPLVGLGHEEAEYIRKISPLAHVTLGSGLCDLLGLETENARNMLRNGTDLHKSWQWLTTLQRVATKCVSLEYAAQVSVHVWSMLRPWHCKASELTASGLSARALIEMPWHKRPQHFSSRMCRHPRSSPSRGCKNSFRAPRSMTKHFRCYVSSL